ncbi:MAG: DNA primase small subunit domain-containing protein [Promethearchaeota archaeon]
MQDKYIRKLFQAYYKAHAKEFPDVSSLQQREFAFLGWNHPGMNRHLGFPSKDALVQYLINTAPRHSYHSATYYSHPTADTMDKKGYQGCDLVVDIDADHIPTPCRDRHNYNICKNCRKIFYGEKPEKCDECEGTKFEKIIWICDECLDVAKQQVFNLVDNFLFKEFNVSPEDLQLYFSGHRGYHIHIETEVFRGLDQDARREISDYITGQGFSYQTWNYKREQNIMQGFDVDQKGWPGKIAQKFYNVLIGGESMIKQIFRQPYYGKPLNSALVKKLISNRQYLLRQLQNKNRIWGISGIGYPSWQRIFEILRDRVMADIDVVVTIDLHRLIRLNGSLHGKAGFKVMGVSYDDLKEFDPLREALAFPEKSDNTLKIQITAPVCPRIRIGDNEYGPFLQGEKLDLPLNAALFILCKNVAQLINN